MSLDRRVRQQDPSSLGPWDILALDALTLPVEPDDLSNLVGLAASRLERGTRLGPFQLIREVGAGTSSLLYEAIREPVGCRVALKIVPANTSDDPRRIRRFQDECRWLSGIVHPHLLPPLEAGQEQGLHYLSWPFVDGESLGQRFLSATARGRPDDLAESAADPESMPGELRAVAGWIAQAARAIDCLHTHDALHRSLSPSELILSPSQGVQVTGLGQALLRDAQEDPWARSATGSGLPFRAPEQLAGRPGVVGHWCDVYSLGACLYALVTRRLPFRGSGAELRAEIRKGFDKVAEPFPKAVPAELQAIVCVAMARDPGARFETAGVLAESLERFVTGIAVSSPTELDDSTR